jgi:DNA-directed RNA polymerase subunit RPC12/RpoP
MVTLICPTCEAKCAVDAPEQKKKVKCPKCGARIMRHPDGKLELLTPGVKPEAPAAPPPAPIVPSTLNLPPLPGEVAPPPASAPATLDLPPNPALSAPPPPPAEAVVKSTGLFEKFAKQDEKSQMQWVIWGGGGVILAAVAGTGLLLKEPAIAVTPLAIGLTAAAIGLYQRMRRRRSEVERQEREKIRARDNEATDVMPSVPKK